MRSWSNQPQSVGVYVAKAWISKKALLNFLNTSTYISRIVKQILYYYTCNIGFVAAVVEDSLMLGEPLSFCWITYIGQKKATKPPYNSILLLFNSNLQCNILIISKIFTRENRVPSLSNCHIINHWPLYGLIVLILTTRGNCVCVLCDAPLWIFAQTIQFFSKLQWIFQVASSSSVLREEAITSGCRTLNWLVSNVKSWGKDLWDYGDFVEEKQKTQQNRWLPWLCVGPLRLCQAPLCSNDCISCYNFLV